MSAPLESLLDRLAERTLALAARMLATTIESRQIAHEAHCQQALETLAAQFEAAGLTEVAATTRQRARRLIAEPPAAQGQALLDELSSGSSSPLTTPHGRWSAVASLDQSPSRRTNGRPRRAKRADSVADLLAAKTQPQTAMLPTGPAELPIPEETVEP